MTYTPVTLERFPGLDLASDPGEGRGAVDGLNFDLDDRGRVRSRDGYVQLASGLSTSQRILPMRVSTTEYLLSFRTSNIDRIDTSGTVVTHTLTAASSITDAVLFGTPTAQYAFVAINGQLMNRYTGTANATASVGKPRYLAVTPADNRLVQASFAAAADSPTGSNGSRSTVFFSDAGAPETFSANNYVHLRPGDGEVIMGMVVWRDLLFVFKETACFVFYGTSTDSGGNPVFNYRRVDLPAPPSRREGAVSGLGIVGAGPDGVYFLTQQGIYRTAGGDAELVGKPVLPLFTPDRTWSGLWWAERRMYVQYFDGSDSTYYTLVYDPTLDAWTRWSIGHYSTVVAWAQATESFTMFNTTAAVFYFDSSVTTDNGFAIPSSYQNAFLDLGSPQVKTVREVEVWGSGTPTVSVFTDYGSTDTNAAAVTLGTAPAVNNAKHRKSYRGTNFSVKLSATSGAWSVNRVDLMLREARLAGVGS